jgi:ketosteroid isomerase-like protein
MQTISFKLMLGLFFLIPFYPFNTMTNMTHSIDPATEVKKALDGQVNAWNNGDLEKAMTWYWNSPEILWVSKSGIQKGYQPVLDGFRQEFADKSKMGIYSYEPLHIEEISGSSVYFVIRWKIVLNGQKIMGGVSSQVWKKIADEWVITAEHAS